MSSTGLSLFVYGIVSVLDGFGLLLIPSTVLKLFRLNESREPWIRILGFVIAAVLGTYYIVSGLYDLTPFAWATVFSRLSVLLFVIIVALLKWTRPSIILFGMIDAAGAVWTLLTLWPK